MNGIEAEDATALAGSLVVSLKTVYMPDTTSTQAIAILL